MKITSKSILEFERELKILINEGSNIYIFGAGNCGKVLGNFLDQKGFEWKGFLDNNPLYLDKMICGKKIYKPQYIENKNNKICILVSISKLKFMDTYYQIIEGIADKCVNENDVLYFDDNYELMDDITLYTKKADKFLKRIEDIKNKYIGNKCFIIGNGPSLKMEDLKKLSGNITMACNTIIDLFEITDWRPTCFCFEDINFINKYISNVDDLKYIVDNCEMVFSSINTEVYDNYCDSFTNLYFYYSKKDIKAEHFSEDIGSVIYGCGTTLYTLFQIAAYMGMKEIYLLGVDFSFRKEIDQDNNLVINESVDNHMKFMKQIEEGLYHKDLILKAFQRAKEYADEHDIKIYNATRGGKLEVFERVNFDDLF